MVPNSSKYTSEDLVPIGLIPERYASSIMFGRVYLFNAGSKFFSLAKFVNVLFGTS